MPAQAKEKAPRRPGSNTAQSLREYARGLAGGLLFSLPILYTMEMWWSGFLATPMRLLAGLAATFCLLILYNLFAGLRCDASPAEILIDSVEEMGLGIIAAALLLWLLDRINLSEIMMLGAELPLQGLLCLAMLSIVVGAIILHYSGFTASVAGSEAGVAAVVRSTTQSYAVALLVSAAVLWFYGRFTGESAVAASAQTVVLGFASMLGASAGRLLLQPS